MKFKKFSDFKYGVTEIHNPKELNPYFDGEFHNLKNERFLFVGLKDNKVVCSGDSTVKSTNNRAYSKNKIVFETLQAHNCDKFIIAHNHPTAFFLPSKQDLNLTRNYIKAGERTNIKCWEHTICANVNNKFFVHYYIIGYLLDGYMLEERKKKKALLKEESKNE